MTTKERAGDRVAIYARVSTLDQDPDNQVMALENHAEARGWIIEAKFVDRGVSGSTDRRPELDRLMDAARKRLIDRVLVARFDRFGRSLKHLVNALDEFKALGVEFTSLGDAVDTSTPTGKLTFAVIAALAEFERTLIVDRVRAGLQRAKARGKRLGRPPVAIKGDPAALRASGMTVRAIAAKLGASRGWVCRALSQKPPRKQGPGPDGE